MGKAAFVLVGAALLVAPASAAVAQEGDGTVTVVHGVPDLTVDVYVNDELTLEDFTFGTVTDPLTLPAGDYELAIRPADADPGSDPAISGSATLPAGANASIVAHLDEAGDPTLGVFVNDTSAVPAGQARVTARHTAAAPEVDVRADGAAIFSGVANGEEGTTEVPAGTYSVDVVLAGTEDVALGPADVTLEEGTRAIAYAVGSAEAGNLELLTQLITGLDGAPDGVPAGEAGLADTGVPLWLVALMGLGAALLLTGGTAAVRDRRR